MAASLLGLGMLLSGAHAQQYPYSTTTSPVSAYGIRPVTGGWSRDGNSAAPTYGLDASASTQSNNSWNANPTPGPTTAPTVWRPLAAPPTASSPRTLVFEKPAGAAPVQRTAYQPPPQRPIGIPNPAEEPPAPSIPLTPPGPGKIFGHLDSEAALQERILQDHLSQSPPDRAVFPDEPVVSRDTYAGRMWPQFTELVEPNYVCHGRLYFEDKNSERYGWDLGVFQPLVSASIFYTEVATVPYRWGTDPCRCYECNAGYCLPGDPVPYLIYPPGFSFTGIAAEGAAIGALLVIFP